MFYRVVAARLKDVVEANEVAFNVCIGVGDGISHPGLSREVDYYSGLIFFKNSVNQCFVGNRAFDKYKPLAK